MRRLSLMIAVLAMVTILGGTLVGPIGGIAAQESAEEGGPDTIGLGIWAFNCPSAPAGDDAYAGCELGGGIIFAVATSGGASLGTCTTEVGVVQANEVAYCYVLDVPFDTELIITADASTVPAGYVPLANPQTMTIQQPGPDAQDFTPVVRFVNVPADTGNDGPDGDEDGGPVVVDPVSCGHFETQQDAQAYFDAHDLADPGVLDADGDGIACERAFGGDTPTDDGAGASAGAVELPKTGAGTAAAVDRRNHVPVVVTLMLMSALAMGLQRRLAC
jgi:hypothetical protein